MIDAGGSRGVQREVSFPKSQIAHIPIMNASTSFPNAAKKYNKEVHTQVIQITAVQCTLTSRHNLLQGVPIPESL